MRSTIIGDGGRANEAQSEFLTLVENAIKQPDLAKSVQRYQLALDETKPRVNFCGDTRGLAAWCLREWW